MIIRTWKPDICDCKFQITKDFDLEKAINKCEMHKGLKDKACFTAVVQRDKDINLTPMLDGESDDDYHNRKWGLQDKAFKESKINKKKNKSK